MASFKISAVLVHIVMGLMHIHSLTLRQNSLANDLVLSLETGGEAFFFKMDQHGAQIHLYIQHQIIFMITSSSSWWYCCALSPSCSFAAQFEVGTKIHCDEEDNRD